LTRGPQHSATRMLLENVKINLSLQNAAIVGFYTIKKTFETQKCLDTFCKASTAQFNDTKTEIIPMGLMNSREELIQNREFNRWKIDKAIHIA